MNNLKGYGNVSVYKNDETRKKESNINMCFTDQTYKMMCFKNRYIICITNERYIWYLNKEQKDGERYQKG